MDGNHAPLVRETDRLDNITNNASAPATNEHSWRWSVLRAAKHYSPSGHRVRQCRSFIVGEDKARIVKTGAGLRWHGLNRCGAHHVCPHCAMAHRSEWSRKIRWLMTALGQAGCHAYFLTATIPHQANDTSEAQIRGLSYAWRMSFTGRRRKYMKKILGYRTYAKSLDYTVTDNGHHFHLHPILWFDRELTDEEQATLSVGLFATWSRAVERKTGKRCDRRAWYLEPVSDDMTTGNYVAKLSGIPYELTSAVTKVGKGRTIWGVLREFTLAHEAGEEPLERDLRIWRQYLSAMKGKRAVDLGQPARDLLKEMPEEASEELEEIAAVASTTYRAVRRERLQGSLLHALQHASTLERAEAAVLLAEAELQPSWREALPYVSQALTHLGSRRSP